VKKIIKHLLLFIFLLTPVISATKTGATKRFVLAVGINDGGNSKVALKYAVSDAKALVRLLTEMGGAEPENVKLLVEPDKKEVLKAIELLNKKVKIAKLQNHKTEVIFYYSGHSDEEGLMLSEEKVTYDILKKSIMELGSDVKVAILDSCSSGAMIRDKGGKMGASFLIDASNDMKGYAFITSSSEDEVSQESDVIKSSFFTHYLVTGLRGAADVTGDGRVSLNEAYQYAYNETLGRTQKTMGGAQHAGYYIKMSGTGDVVITEIQKSESRLEMGKGLYGIFTIRNQENTLIAELQKKSEQKIQMGVDSGEYFVINQRENRIYEAVLHIEPGSSVTLFPDSFAISEREYTFSRGNSLVGNHIIPINTQLVPMYSEYYESAICKFSISLFGSYCGRLEGYSASLGVDIIHSNIVGFQGTAIGAISGGNTKGVQASGVFNITTKDFNGIQGAAIFNITRGEGRAIQGSGIFNIIGKNFTGIQGAGIFNMANGNFEGVQGAGIFNMNSGTFKGVQGAGIFDMNNGDFKGVQGAGIFNMNAGTFKGVQGAGIFNMNAGIFKGVQGAGIFNMNSGTFKGVQGAGIFNMNSGTTRGIQGAGVLNYAKTNAGLQAGLINIASSSSGIALGLINLTTKDGIDAAIWMNSRAQVNTGLQFNYNFLYSILHIGYIPGDSRLSGVLTGYKAGVKYSILKFYMAGDVGFYSKFRELSRSWSSKHFSADFVPSARVSGGYKLFTGTSVFTGVEISNSIPYQNYSEMKNSLQRLRLKELYFDLFAGTSQNFSWE